MNSKQIGVLSAIFAYILWGILPIYWKWINHVPASEILANRIVWSFVFSLLLIILLKKVKLLSAAIRTFKENWKQSLIITIASLIISSNWFLYIWAVNSNHVTEASLGYYINPLISMLLGIIFLREKLNKIQLFSFFLAAVGVVILTIAHGSFPWVAFTLAVTFGVYGLAKKFVQLDSVVGLTLETFVVTPIALVYMIYLFGTGNNSFLSISIGTDILLMGAGIATALPLIFFAKGAQKIPLSMLGILQYIAPTLMLLIGIFIYNEPFSHIQLIAFTFIWAALALYTGSNLKWEIFKPKKNRGMHV